MLFIDLSICLFAMLIEITTVWQILITNKSLYILYMYIISVCMVYFYA